MRKPRTTLRERLADMLCQKTGALFEPHRIVQNNPMHVRYVDCCRWDAWGDKPLELPGGKTVQTRVHVYSWDRMADCVRSGFDLIEHRGDRNDFEVSAKEARL